jgi:hypothetical protein
MHALLSDPGGVLTARHFASQDCCLPAHEHRRLSPTFSGLILPTTTINYFGAQSHSLHPRSAQLRTLLTEFARGLRYWPAGSALAKWDFSGLAEFTHWVTLPNFIPLTRDSQRFGLLGHDPGKGTGRPAPSPQTRT